MKFRFAIIRSMLRAKKINSEIWKIDQKIKTLRARKALLLKEQPVAWLLQNTLPGEKVTKRNFDKLVALAHVIDFLKQKQKHGLGASTKEISAHLTETIGLAIKDATLRSYLLRFKEEARITHNKEDRIWTLPSELK